LERIIDFNAYQLAKGAMKMKMRAKINTGAIAMGVAGVIMAGAVAGAVAADTKQPAAPSAVDRLRQEHPAGCYLIWGERDLLKTCDFLKGGQIMVQWRDVAPAHGKFDWSRLDEGLRFFAEIGRPTTVQVNANDKKPDWLWDYVANCGNNRGVIPQYWDPRYIEIQKELIEALADHLKGELGNGGEPSERDLLELLALPDGTA
jgi:hypothetical protein